MMIKYGQTAGAVVGKSQTYEPQLGNPQPRITKVGQWGLINWEDLPNIGYKAFAQEITKAKAGCSCPIIGSIGPLRSIDQQLTIAYAFEEAGADAIELDFKWGAGFEDDLIYRITRAVKDSISIPIIAKLSPFVGDIVESARMVEEAGADAITAINTIFPAMKIQVRTGKPALSSGFGGLSGAPILALAVAAVYQIYRETQVPIIASGGVVTGTDALEHVMAGAEAVQICTAAMIEGPTVFTRLQAELNVLLDDLGYASLEACRGIAHRTKLHVPASATVKVT